MSVSTSSAPVRSGAAPSGAIVQQPVAPTQDKVKIENLSFFYGQNRALKDITLSLRENEITAFIGPSGCGKSTLLRVLNRIYELYPNQRAEGTVLLDGEDILDPEAGRQRASRQDRHGVSEADAFPDVDLREHRLRRAALRASAAPRDG